MQPQTRTSLFGIALAVALVGLPAGVTAQQPGQQQQEACTARISPTQLAAGEAATPVTITVSRTIGDVTGVDAGESGITLAEASALPRTPLAGPNERPTPIRMGDSENQWIVYLSTTEAEAGPHELTFRSERGACTGQLTVAGPAR
jgi:hypothetical protein